MGQVRSKRPLVVPSITSTAPIKASQLALFIANQQTGTGSSQNIAHGLGVTPSKVIAVPTDGGTVTAYGTHDATNIKVTVSSTKKFDVIAFV